MVHPMVRMTRQEIGLLRLVAQRIAGPGLATASGVVGWLAAVQAQDLLGALTSVALRTDGGTRREVEAALTAGTVVRSWPMRGTLHLVSAVDLPWMLDLLAVRAVARAQRRRAELELDDAAVERARELAVAALAGGRQLTRQQLLARWQAGGLATDNQRGYHLLGHLAQTGTICLGPLGDGEQLFVLVEEWVPHPRRLPREEALGEVAARFFRSHGPATVKDLIRWTGLTAADVRVGVAVARPELATITVDGDEHLLDPRTPELLATCRRTARGVFLLPGFDEFVLGYGDRSAVLPPEYADLIAPGGNGVLRPSVVVAGQILGTWRHHGSGKKRTLRATPFGEAFPERVTRAFPRVYAALP